MKQGSTDDPFADDPLTDESLADDGTDDDETDDDVNEDADRSGKSGAGTSGNETQSRTETDAAGRPTSTTTTADSDTAGTTTDADRVSTTDSDSLPATDDRTSTDAGTSTASSGTPTPTTQRRSLPYIHARDGVKDGRTQRPVFLRDHVETGIDELVAAMEAEFGEDVYKTDVTEAAMAVAQENPELVFAKLEEWGYGWT